MGFSRASAFFPRRFPPRAVFGRIAAATVKAGFRRSRNAAGSGLLQGGNRAPCCDWKTCPGMTHSRGLLQAATRPHSQLPSPLLRRGGEARILYSCKSWNLDGTSLTPPRPPSFPVTARQSSTKVVHLLTGPHLVMTVNHDSWKSSGPSHRPGVLPSDISSCDEAVTDANPGGGGADSSEASSRSGSSRTDRGDSDVMTVTSFGPPSQNLLFFFFLARPD